jgi:hypothetical protein
MDGSSRRCGLQHICVWRPKRTADEHEKEEEEQAGSVTTGLEQTHWQEAGGSEATADFAHDRTRVYRVESSIAIRR